MLRRVFNVFLILALTVAFGFLKNILLARGLTKAGFGLFNLVMTLVGLIYPIALLGQHNALVRRLSKSSPGQYDWKTYVQKLLTYMIPVAAGAAILSGFFYDFGSTSIAFMIVAILSSMVADAYTYILRSMGKYESSILLHRSVRIGFPLAVLIFIYFGRVELPSIFITFGVLYLLHAVFVMGYTYRNASIGKKPLDTQTFKEGLFILGSDLSLLVVGSADKLFLGQLVTMDLVGTYFAVLSLMRIFDLALQAIEYVLLPQSNKVAEINFKAMIAQILGVALLICVFYLALGGRLVHIVFSGKYDQGINLIPYFCVVGVLRMLYVAPAAVISGRLGTPALKGLVKLNSAIMVMNIVISFVFIMRWQITGALVSVSIVWFLRTCAAYSVAWRHANDTVIATT